MKILPVTAELFHTNRRTDTQVTKLRVDFRNFVNSTKNEEITIPKDKEEDSIRLSVSEGLLSGANMLQMGGHLWPSRRLLVTADVCHMGERHPVG
jgi:hypothetical protein